MPAVDVQASLPANRRPGQGSRPGGHILTGPVFVTGAEPGDALEVKVFRSICRLPTATTAAPGQPWELRGGPPADDIQMDRKAMTATFAPGIVIPSKPFFVSMGVAPPTARSRRLRAAAHRAR